MALQWRGSDQTAIRADRSDLTTSSYSWRYNHAGAALNQLAAVVFHDQQLPS
jgi:hypothetical protein